MIVATVCVTASAHADSVVLKMKVRLGSNETSVKLRDVAYLEGDDVTRLGDIEVATLDEDGTTELTMDTVRAKLAAAGAKIALLDLSGRAVTIIGASSARPVAMKGLSLDESSKPRVAAVAPASPRIEFLAADAVGTTTPRGLIAQMLTDVHAPKNARVRIAIDGENAAVVDSIGPHRYEVVPLTSLSADRMMVRIVERDGDVVVARHDLSVVPSIETTVATATAVIRRGQPIDGSVEIGMAWVAPSEIGKLARADALSSATAADTVALGERVTEAKMRKPVEIKKNDKVTVRREIGLVAIELVAVAVDDGAIGDVIHLRAVDRKNRKDSRTFTAKVTGPGRAVISEGT